MNSPCDPIDPGSWILVTETLAAFRLVRLPAGSLPVAGRLRRADELPGRPAQCVMYKRRKFSPLFDLGAVQKHDITELKTTSLTEDTLMLVKEQIMQDQEIERLIEAQLKLSRYWNKPTDEIDIIIK